MKKKYQRKPGLINKTGYTPGYETENNPYNIIPGGDITMENTPYPLYAMPLNQNGQPMGQGTVMQPGGQYKFGGASYVAEVPMYKDGGSKQSWISNKIGMLMDEGYPQKQAIAIAYSMYEQKHKNGGYQLPKYQLAGTAELDEYGQPLPKAQPNPTPSTNSQASGQKTFAPGNVNSWDIDNDGVPDTIQKPEGNPLVESKPDYNKMYMDMSTEDEQLKQPEDTSEEARNKAENSFGGNPLYQFANLEGDMGTDDALFHLGKNIESGNALGIAASATSALLKGGKDFLAGMGSQRRQNYVMQSYYDKQRDNMTGAGREQSLKMGGYYQEGGEEEYGDLVNKYPNRNPQIRQENTTKTDWFEEGMDKDTYYGFKNQLEAEGYKSIPKPNGMSTTSKEASTSSARDTWEAKTGMPWSEAKRLGYTDGSPKDNMKLLSELNDSRFNSKNLRKAPMVSSTPQLNKNKPKSPTWYKEGKYKKAYDESAFQDDIDRNKQPYPEDMDIVETKKPVAKVPAKKPVAKTPQLQKKAPAKNYTQAELDAVWGKSRVVNPLEQIINPDKRKLQSGVITDKRQNMTHVIKDGKVVKSFPVLTGQNPEGNSNPYTVEQLEKNKKGRSTPTGTYIMEPNANIYGARGFNLNPIAAFDEKAPNASNVAIHVTYPGEFKQRNPLYKKPAQNRYASYGCINGRCEDTEDLANRFQKSDTLMVVDSKNSKDKALLSRFGIRQDGGYYQEGGMQPGMEEGMEGQMSNPQEEGMEQQGGGQEEQIMQEVAQALQQGADPQQIVQQLVQMGIPEQQAVQMVQMVIQQLQGEQQPQQQGTPQLRMGGYYQQGGEAMDEQMEGEDEGAEGESENLEQIEDQVEQALKQGADPQQILQQLVQMGIPQEQAIQMIQEILQEIQGGETEMEAPEMKNGGSYLNTLKGKTIKDYTYNPKTNSYTVSYE